MPTKIPGASDDYLPRYLDGELRKLFPQLPVTAIDGTKGVGKAETAQRWVKYVLVLDNPEVGQLIAANIVNQLTKYATTCIDEWQKYPSVWDAMRHLVGQQTPNRFLLTGNATSISGADTHNGAGCIASLRLRPLSLAERPSISPSVFISRLFLGGAEISGETSFGLLNYAKAICKTGIPQVFRVSLRVRQILIDGYIQRIIDHDVPKQGVLMCRPQNLRVWVSTYATASSTTISYSAILNAVSPGESDKPAKSATQNTHELLTQLWILDPIPGWTSTGTSLKRPTFGPKRQLFDPGIAATLTGITPEALLSDNPGSMKTFRQLFEALVTLAVRMVGQATKAKCCHLRTRAREHEIDPTSGRYDGKVTAFEVELAATVSEDDLKHLHWLGKQIGKRLVECIVITTGQLAFRRPSDTAIVPLALLEWCRDTLV